MNTFINIKDLIVLPPLTKTQHDDSVKNYHQQNQEELICHNQLKGDGKKIEVYATQDGLPCNFDVLKVEELRKESSTSTIPCIPDVGKPLSKDVKPREDESSRLSSIFNREEPSISAVPCSLEELKGLESEIDIGGRKIDGKKENTKIQGVFSKVCQSNDVGNSLEPSLEWTSRNAAQSRDEADEAIRCKQRVDMQQSLEQEPAAFSEKLEVAEGETLYPSDVIKICASTLPKKKKR
ncbi:hypothetical protein Ancab_039359 [Ancistrocladus abbreviatus]